MNDLYRRWFEPPTVQAAVSSMLRGFADVPPAQQARVRNERKGLQTKYALVAAGAAAVFVAVVIGALLLFAPKPKEREANYGGLALLCLGVIGAAGAGVYFFCGSNNQRRAERDEAFEELCRRHTGLRPARRTEIEDSSVVGTVPWFHSEEWSHTYGLACGEYRGSQIIAVECTHVVDPILVTTDSALMQGLAGLVAGKHKRLHLRAMDATVFVEPLPDVSDLLFVPKNDPSRAYYKRALKQQDCDLSDAFNLPRGLRSKYWMAAASPDECGVLFETELPALLASRKWCIVQVVGGYCVVMTSQWHGNRPGNAPGTVEAIAENLEFARAVYEQLRRFSTGDAHASAGDVEGATAPAHATTEFALSAADDPAAPSYAAESAGLATAVAEPEVSPPVRAEYSAEPRPVAQGAAAPTQTQPRRRRPHSTLAKFCLLGFGVPASLVGLLATVSLFAVRQQGHAVADWPQADARIVDSSLDVQTRSRGGQEVMLYEPRVRYEYEVDGQRFTGNRIRYGITSPTMDKRAVEDVLDSYPKDAVVKVHYHADRCDTSVLEPGVEEESKMIRFMYGSAVFALVGLLATVYGFTGKRVRPAQ